MDSEQIRFKCPSCAATLTAPFAMRNASGPCPICGVTINPPAQPVRIRPSVSKKSRRISADSVVDHESNERRETWKSMRIMGLFLLVVAICYATLKFIQQAKPD
jgi:hypothetical protein